MISRFFEEARTGGPLTALICAPMLALAGWIEEDHVHGLFLGLVAFAASLVMALSEDLARFRAGPKARGLAALPTLAALLLVPPYLVHDGVVKPAVDADVRIMATVIEVSETSRSPPRWSAAVRWQDARGVAHSALLMVDAERDGKAARTVSSTPPGGKIELLVSPAGAVRLLPDPMHSKAALNALGLNVLWSNLLAALALGPGIFGALLLSCAGDAMGAAKKELAEADRAALARRNRWISLLSMGSAATLGTAGLVTSFWSVALGAGLLGLALLALLALPLVATLPFGLKRLREYSRYLDNIKRWIPGTVLAYPVAFPFFVPYYLVLIAVLLNAAWLHG